MTLAQFAIARCVHVLEQKDPAGLTRHERWLMEMLVPAVNRYREQEEQSAKPKRTAGAGGS
jgi:hypothetical protein